MIGHARRGGDRRSRRYEDAGADQVVFGMLSTTMPIEIAIEAIETFGKHVIPRVRQGPGAPHDTPARGVRRQARAAHEDRARPRARRAPELVGNGGHRSTRRQAGCARRTSRARHRREPRHRLRASRSGSRPRAPRSRSPRARSTPRRRRARRVVCARRSSRSRRPAGAPSRSPPTSPTPTTGPGSCPRSKPALGPIDVLVNNAAAAIYAPDAEIPLKRRRLTFEVNVHAPDRPRPGGAPGHARRGAGLDREHLERDVEAPEGPTVRPRAMKLGVTTATYGASKAALERFTTGLAAELYGERHRGELARAGRRGPHAGCRRRSSATCSTRNPEHRRAARAVRRSRARARHVRPADPDRPRLLLPPAPRRARLARSRRPSTAGPFTGG